MNDKTQTQSERLLASFRILEPRMLLLAERFADRVEIADPGVRLMFPSDTPMIAELLDQFLAVLSDADASSGQIESMTHELVQAAAERGMNESHLPLVREALESSMAEVAGYTWTPNLTQAWASRFEKLTLLALESLNSARTQPV